MTTTYHVYAEDGYESAHRTQRAAERAAQRGHRTRHVPYRVVRTDAHGLTGGGHGVVVAVYGGTTTSYTEPEAV